MCGKAKKQNRFAMLESSLWSYLVSSRSPDSLEVDITPNFGVPQFSLTTMTARLLSRIRWIVKTFTLRFNTINIWFSMSDALGERPDRNYWYRTCVNWWRTEDSSALCFVEGYSMGGPLLHFGGPAAWWQFVNGSVTGEARCETREWEVRNHTRVPLCQLESLDNLMQDTLPQGEKKARSTVWNV